MAESDSHKYVAEFVGTYILVLTIGCNVVGGAGDMAVLSIASALMVMIYCYGPVSGGHLNPAVTLAVKCKNDAAMDWGTVAMYWVMQLLGGICGAMSYWGLMGDTVNLAPAPGFSWYDAMIVEFLFTFMLA